MNLDVMTPTTGFAENEIVKIITDDEKGGFCILPRHIDYVAAIVPGILTCENVSGTVSYFAVDEGILVKKGDNVRVSVKNAFKGTDLKDLSEIVKTRYEALEKEEVKTREILSKLEGDITKILMGSK